VFEPGATVKSLDPLLGELKEATIPLVRKIAATKRRPDDTILTRRFPHDVQLSFGREVCEAIGFDFARGRIDLSTHPFCSGFAPGDVRLTTRVFEDDLRPCLFGLIHEAGHGMYEQGLAEKLQRTPIGQAVSLGIHESQSRLWENVIGRSLPFWRFFLPRLKKAFPGVLDDVTVEAFHFAVNEVRPSFVRVEADEVTYNLHIALRYEMEKGLFAGTIRPRQVPELWNRKMKELLGITPGRDSEGALQDVHWSAGLMGYFPTYCSATLRRAALGSRATDLPGVEKSIGRASWTPIRDRMRSKIHRHGREYWPRSWCARPPAGSRTRASSSATSRRSTGRCTTSRRPGRPDTTGAGSRPPARNLLDNWALARAPEGWKKQHAWHPVALSGASGFRSARTFRNRPACSTRRAPLDPAPPAPTTIPTTCRTTPPARRSRSSRCTVSTSAGRLARGVRRLPALRLRPVASPEDIMEVRRMIPAPCSWATRTCRTSRWVSTPGTPITMRSRPCSTRRCA
jgi:hypothetical protein